MDFYGTLGAACAGEGTLRAMFRAGMTGARLNLSHTTLDASASLIEAFWSAARAEGVSARLIIDLQGPEVRVGALPAPVALAEDGTVVLGSGGIPVPPEVVAAAEREDRIALDDSAMELLVTEKRADALVCCVLRGGTLMSRKSLAVLGKDIGLPTLAAADEANLDRAAAYGVTDILQPFVRDHRDVETLREALERRGLAHVRIMAKIENAQGLEHLEAITDTADEICIARGDLGNAMPLWELPRVQKWIAREVREAGKPFCVVTQLLWSMEQRAVPTRAEVSDIYNAVLDGASSLMLTGETAIGKYPVEAIEYLVKTARTAE